jgi:hypothetical protein
LANNKEESIHLDGLLQRIIAVDYEIKSTEVFEEAKVNE